MNRNNRKEDWLFIRGAFDKKRRLKVPETRTADNKKAVQQQLDLLKDKKKS